MSKSSHTSICGFWRPSCCPGSHGRSWACLPASRICLTGLSSGAGSTRTWRGEGVLGTEPPRHQPPRLICQERSSEGLQPTNTLWSRPFRTQWKKMDRAIVKRAWCQFQLSRLERMVMAERGNIGWKYWKWTVESEIILILAMYVLVNRHLAFQLNNTICLNLSSTPPCT